MTNLLFMALATLIALLGFWADHLSEKVHYWKQTALASQNSVAVITAERDSLLLALSQRDKTISEIKAARAQNSRKLQQVKKHDEQVRAWHDTDIPAPVLRLLNPCTSSATGNSASDDDRNNPHALN
jgi:hypothetical protein